MDGWRVLSACGIFSQNFVQVGHRIFLADMTFLTGSRGQYSHQCDPSMAKFLRRGRRTSVVINTWCWLSDLHSRCVRTQKELAKWQSVEAVMLHSIGNCYAKPRYSIMHELLSKFILNKLNCLAWKLFEGV